jgi:hypothetical protein
MSTVKAEINENKVILDIEKDTAGGKRREVLPIEFRKSFIDTVNQLKSTSYARQVVRYIDANTGQTIKGDRFDTTELSLSDNHIMKHLRPGVKLQPPSEPTQYEPEDRIQENTKMKKSNQLKSLIQECIREIKQENDPKAKLKASLRGVVREVIKEFVTRPTGKTVEKDEAEKENKQYSKDGNERLDKANAKLQKELETLVHAINSDWEVYWDDNRQLVVQANNLVSVRIIPKFENNFDIEIMVKLVDRVKVVAVTWEQAKATIKATLTDMGDETSADVAKDKSDENEKGSEKNDGKDAGPRHDITKKKEVGDTKKDNKDYNEKAVEKDEDQPSAPMKDVGDKKGLNKDITKTQQVKPPKHKADEGADKLRIEIPTTKKHRIKKS